MLKYSKNKKLNTLLLKIENSLIDNLGIDELKRYYNAFRGYYVDCHILQYYNLLVYYGDIRNFYIECGYSTSTINKMSDSKIWETYKRQVGYVVRRLLSEV